MVFLKFKIVLYHRLISVTQKTQHTSRPTEHIHIENTCTDKLHADNTYAHTTPLTHALNYTYTRT